MIHTHNSKSQCQINAESLKGLLQQLLKINTQAHCFAFHKRIGTIYQKCIMLDQLRKHALQECKSRRALNLGAVEEMSKNVILMKVACQRHCKLTTCLFSYDLFHL